MPEKNSRLVYSSDGERIQQLSTHDRKPAKPSPSRGTSPRTPSVPNDGVVRIQRSKSGRGGKTVTLVTGLPGSEREMDALLKTLKQLCGAGGTREGTTIEIQGDHRERIQAKLEALGHRVRLAGG